MNKKRIATFYSKMILSTVLFLGMFGASFAPLTVVKTEALTPEAQKCSEEPKKQGKQANPDYKMSWMYSEKKQACFYTFAEVKENSHDMNSGIRKKDANGNVTEFYTYEKEQFNSALTILSMIELPNGDIVIGGSEWLMSTDSEGIGFYAIIMSTGSVKYKNKTAGQSIEKVNTDNNVIVLAGSARHTNFDKPDTYVTPYIVTTDMNGNELAKKEFENLRGYWFADAKMYKSKYIRTSLGEYKSQSNGSEGPVKWLNAETLAEVSETEANLEDQTTYTKNGYVKYDGKDITSYNQDGDKLKSVAYTSSVSRAIPLPQQNENTFVIAEIGSTVVLKSITVNGEQGKESVDTKIAVAATDKIDFRQSGDTISLYIIGSKGEEFLYDLDLSKLVAEKPKTDEKQPSQKNNKTPSTQKDASDENKMIFFIMLGAATVAIAIIVISIILFMKKRRVKSDDGKLKPKVAKKVKKQSQPDSPKQETVQQEQSGYLQPQFNPYADYPVQEEQVYQQNNWISPEQDDEYGNVINQQPQYDAYGNVLSEQPQYDAYGNVLSDQLQYDEYGNVLSEQPQYDAYGNVIEHHFSSNNE